MEQLVEIAGDNRHLRLFRGFMVVESKGEELGRTPLEDIGVVLAHGFGLTYSNNLLVALAERGVPVLICNASLAPAALMWPVVSHHRQAERLEAQANVGAPLKKRCWQQVIRWKIANQAHALELLGRNALPVAILMNKVKSGDADNTEGQAARKYWPLLLGPEFFRDRNGPEPNNLLNYGYMVLRSATARAVMAAGLHPSFSIHHKNMNNPMRLVDDLMEPFRPVVDLLVHALVALGRMELDKQAKAVLAQASKELMRTATGHSPVHVLLQNWTHDYVQLLLGLRREIEPLGEVQLPDVAGMLERMQA